MHTKEEKLEAFGRLLDIMDALRERCPWNAGQTMQSIRPMTEEEVYELSDAILRGESAEICKEIGDLLYHMVFYARIAQENGDFDIADSLGRICDKMVFRHAHVFRPDGSLVPEGEAPSAKEIADTWELVKAKEKGGNKTVMGGIPDSMPAILKAMSMQEKARGCGFDWEEPSQVWDKVCEEMGEAREAIDIAQRAGVNGAGPMATAAGNDESDSPEAAHVREEFGDLLFAVINAARLYGVDPEAALSATCSKFRRRFTYLEQNTLHKGRSLKDMSLAEMDAIWDEAKAKGL
ncbi:MAG: nucleoside triphosphate pyrophosphohydrolase [Bacteroidales bacterium]|nr:nucleoside triphosphate pyrophosphohydrolase [Candidatus Cryptobacteroides aphodequi]